MEYMLLINVEGEPGSATPEESAAMSAAFGEYTRSLVDAGALVGGDQLHPPVAQPSSS